MTQIGHMTLLFSFIKLFFVLQWKAPTSAVFQVKTSQGPSEDLPCDEASLFGKHPKAPDFISQAVFIQDLRHVPHFYLV